VGARAIVAGFVGLAALSLPAGAGATVPGGDGLIVFAYESPVPALHLTQNDVWVMSSDGSGLTQLTDTPRRQEFGPVWSPDGTRIAYWRTHAPFGPGSIWVMDPDGSHRHRLTDGIDARDPAWSPDGRRIAFTWTNPWKRGGIWTMRSTDGGGMRRVTHRQDFEPSWSPDGSTIAFTRSFVKGSAGNLWVVNVATRKGHEVTHVDGYDHQVSWSPDGSWLVFERAFFVTAKVAVVRPDGTGYDPLGSGFFDADPVFAPSGTAIVFVSDRPGGSFLPDLWLMDPDGAGKHAILDLPYASTQPDWQTVAP
jgi:TolB protein